MKSIRIGLLPRIFIAILLGIILGQILPEELSRIFYVQFFVFRISRLCYPSDYSSSCDRSYCEYR